MKGRVARFFREKSFGFITGEDNVEYFFHIDSVINLKLNQVQQGMEAEFEPTEGRKGPRAEQVVF